METTVMMDTVCDKVMLIDDSTIDNFVSQKIIERYGFSNSVATFTRAQKALNFLSSVPADELPDLIFLDLNMPAMNGFQFLAEYNRLDSSIKDKCRIVILSSTVNPAEMQLAMRDHNVFAFCSKPLMKNNLDKIKSMFSGDYALAI